MCILCELEGKDINFTGMVLKDKSADICFEHFLLTRNMISDKDLHEHLNSNELFNRFGINSENLDNYVRAVKTSRYMSKDLTIQERFNEVINIMIKIMKEDEEGKDPKKGSNIKKGIDRTYLNKSIFNYDKTLKALEKTVIGQDEAKESLILAFQNHILRQDHDNIPKGNVLMLGPTGSGKTLLVNTLANLLELPYYEADMSSMTSSGYVGGSLDEIFTGLLLKYDNNIDYVSNAVIYLDEIDKISANEKSGKDVGGLGVQQELLKILEGTKVPIRQDNRIVAYVDTKNMMFICTGAFENYRERIVEKNKKGIGFGTSEVINVKKTKMNKLQKQLDNLGTYGLSSELLGRLPIVTQTNKLKTEELEKIIKEVQMEGYHNLFEARGLKLKLSSPAIKYIASTIEELPTGARSITSVMNEVLRSPQLRPDKYTDKHGLIKLGINEVKSALS